MHPLIGAVVALVMLLSWAGPASAHFGAAAVLLAPEEVLPGDRFTVSGSDVAPGSVVSIELRSEAYAAPLGEFETGSEGHFEIELQMPAAAPIGFVELIASSRDGTRVSTWLHVGRRTAESGSPPLPTATSAAIDLSMVILGLLIGGAAGAVGYTFLRRRRSSSTGGQQDRRGTPRKSPRPRVKT